MGFVSFEVEKMRMFLVQSVVRWYRVLVRSWGPFPCETTDQSMVPISAGQLAELWTTSLPVVHARAWKSCLPFPVTNSSFIPNSGPPMPYFSRYKRPSILVPACEPVWPNGKALGW